MKNKFQENHNKINDKNKIIIKQKEILIKIYRDYYKDLYNNIYKPEEGKNLEIGSGPSFIKSIIKDCITSDAFYDEDLDRKENVYKLNFQNDEISNLLMIDVFHHLQYPMAALKEMNRVLEKKGRVIMIEPSMGLLPRIIFSLFHKEPNGFNFFISNKEVVKNDIKFFAAQSFPFRIFYKKELNFSKYFKLIKIENKSDFSFLGSGGFSFPAMYPNFCYKFIKVMDKYFSYFPKIFSARMIVVLEKND